MLIISCSLQLYRIGIGSLTRSCLAKRWAYRIRVALARIKAHFCNNRLDNQVKIRGKMRVIYRINFTSSFDEQRTDKSSSQNRWHYENRLIAILGAYMRLIKLCCYKMFWISCKLLDVHRLLMCGVDFLFSSESSLSISSLIVSSFFKCSAIKIKVDSQIRFLLKVCQPFTENSVMITHFTVEKTNVDQK